MQYFLNHWCDERLHICRKKAMATRKQPHTGQEGLWLDIQALLDFAYDQNRAFTVGFDE